MTISNKLYPLTLPQEAFYYDYLLNEDNLKYIMGGIFIINGELDVELYKKAYNYAAGHFDGMRIRFVKDGDSLYQQFEESPGYDIKYMDFRGCNNPAEEALEFLIKEYKKPLTHYDGFLYSEIILRTGDSQYMFGPKFHHFVNDAMGRSVFNDAVSNAYNYYLKNGVFPEIKPYSYIDFINDDIEYRNSETYKNSLSYWKQKFYNLPEPFKFSSKKRSIKNIPQHTERLALNLHRVCFESILSLAEETGSTTYQVILALISIILYKCYNNNEFILGMPVLNRSNHKFRSTPGLFMNMMGLRLVIKPDDEFEDLVKLIKAEIREGYRHQRFPLRETLKHLRSSGEFNGELFDVTVVYRNSSFSQYLGDAKFTSITLDSEIRSESLSIEIDEFDEEGNINLFFNYNPLVLSREEINQFVHCFETILMGLVLTPGKKIKDIIILNDFEAYKILHEFNNTSEEIKTTRTIVKQFEETSRMRANTPAVICNNKSVSYHELNEKANCIANYLLDNYNLQPEEIVCLISERSIDAIAAMLGIMKTGAAYLPVDPGYPVERIKYIVENSGARIILSDNSNTKNLCENVINITEINSTKSNNPGIDISPDNLAYVIYTSGSTGNPKGVMVEHTQFMNMFVNVIDTFGIKETDRVLQFASLGFDASVMEIFQALLTGAALVISDKDTIRNAEYFMTYITEKKVTVATLPPVYLNVLDHAALPYLRTLITAGEQAIPADVNYYKRNKRFINAYGPTENSVCTSLYVAENSIDYDSSVPIGKPAANSKVYILNEYLEPVPAGFEGELCISGSGIARGYLNNQELTEKKFVNNPFEAGTRLYRTGDMARWMADGNIEYLGRIDDQVKINGHRIEPGEIEAQLSKFSGVKEAVVLDIISEGYKELAAFIISKEKIEINEIKQYLRRYLPEYMIPSHFIFPGTLPLTPNGKTDKRVLKRLAEENRNKGSNVEQVLNKTEEQLVSMFEEILNVYPVKPDDNFFELGGESLKITRLISKIKKEFRQDISFKVIFDSPTVRGIAAELKAQAVENIEDIRTASAKEYFDLSHAQRRMWILAQNKENAAAYNMPVPLLLDGKIKPEVLERSIRQVINRHEALRTIYVTINGAPYQKILDNYNFNVEEEDVSKEKNRDDAAKQSVKSRITQPFDLAYDIPFRACLIKLEENKHILLLVIHHIAGDGISTGIILNEISELYNAGINGREFNLPLLRIQYKDYCEYEKTIIESNKYVSEKRYWIEKLKSPLPVIELPVDRHRPSLKTYSGSYKFYTIDQTISSGIIQFCKSRRISTFVFLTAVVNILLSKYTSQDDIIIGSPVAGRSNHELENQVGLYLNTVALRNQVRSTSLFSEFLEQVKACSTEAITNSNYPFDKLIEVISPERDTSRTPVFDILLQLQQTPELNLENVKSSLYEAEFKYNKFDLTFTFAESGQKINFTIGYNTDLFNSRRIDKIARHINNICKNILCNPEKKIKEISLFDDKENEYIVKISAGPEKIYSMPANIAASFEAQVNKTPENIALVLNDKKFTFRELNERANKAALEIKKQALIQPDDIIGIMAGRSEYMIIGMLGILKAGAAYMPIDPAYPVERISFMLNNSKAKALLVEECYSEIAKTAVLINKSDSLSIIDLTAITGRTKNNPVNNAEPANLVYVIYTSGSTGRPKGVMVEHHSLYNLAMGLSDVYGEQPVPLNIALISPFVFDASVKQIFYSLLNGHCLNIVPEETKTSGRKLLEFYKEHKIDVTDGTPVHLEIIQDELEDERGAYLPARFVIGGQQLMHTTIKKLYNKIHGRLPVITNVYGPTECCDVSSAFNITPEQFQGMQVSFGMMPIGKPLNNVSIYILDNDFNKVPPGVNGELFIAGEGVARGYINNEELTANKYITLAGHKNERLYRTGDIGRYLEDGSIVLSGRNDDQIKLRGFRIELSEIENTLTSYDKITSASIITTGEENNIKIAAYYCSSRVVNEEDLRQFLSARLPEYMIPSFFIQLQNLPLTTNGKVDKKLLPFPVTDSVSEYTTEPAGVVEKKLCLLWQELLNVSKVNPSDNFFRLGGHSLIAIRLTSRIHKLFNVELNIWEVFQNPTVIQLAKVINSKNPSVFAAIERTEKRDYYPLSHSQKRLWLLSRLEGRSSQYNLPAALLLKGTVNIEILKKAYKALVQRHESLRTSFIEIDGEPFQVISDKTGTDIEVVNYTGLKWDKEILEGLAVDYFRYEFDLSKTPLICMRIVVLSEKEYLLLFNMHHIISDGWSIDVMIKEIQNFYNAFMNNSEAASEPLRIHYKDYAVWQNKLLEDKSIQPVKNFWMERLSKPLPLLNLPTDYKRPEVYTDNGELIRYTLDKSITEALTEISGRHNASLYMSLLAAVYILMYKYSGDKDIILGSPVAGRQHDDLDNQVGFYINTLALRSEIIPESTFSEYLDKVKVMLTEALDNQVYPFDRLVDDLDVGRIHNRNPLFDVMVTWMVKNGMEINMEFDGSEAEAIDFNINSSMFDLTFFFSDNEGKTSCAIEYNSSLYKRESVLQMIQNYCRLLDSVIANPDESIKNLEIIPEKEKQKILQQSKNDSGILLTGNVINRFYSRAAESKTGIALVAGEKSISYTELDELSNRIANYIIRKIKPAKDDIISVIADDPVYAVAAMLGVMKTGAAYLPIMRDIPVERITFVINNSSCRAVISDVVLSEEILSSAKVPVLYIQEALAETTSAPLVEIEQDSLAYVIYTSGSTGLPKGVLVEHGALVNLFESINTNIYSRYCERLNELMISSFAFDVSIKQVLSVLCSGNTLHIPGKDKRLDPREISAYIIENKINIADLTPSLFSVMMEEGFDKVNKPHLKELFIGSEALPYKLIKTFFNVPANHKINITNFYGPTECCVESSFYKFDPAAPDEDIDIAPIGKPILNGKIFILDEYLKLCPAGVPGEICIAGSGLARGYLNDPAKTNERFVTLPYLNNERLYRSGDKGKKLPDGNIEFLGRTDDQVKIRGYRIELQEIEKHLRDISGIKDCAVILYEKDEVKELAAYYTSDIAQDSQKLKSRLAHFLPAYMVPAYFARIEAIPLSSNGKLNKKMLPAPEGLLKSNIYIAPKDDIDAAILRICSEVLKKESIGLADNFFEVGGHSLNAVRIISRIQKEFNVELALKEIFYNPVLTSIADNVRKLLETAEAEDDTITDGTEIVPISDDELELLSNLDEDEE